MPPAVQNAYTDTYRKGFPGMIANSELANKISRVLQTATLAFGQPVARGTLDDTCILMATTKVLLGISVRDETLLHATPDQYIVGDNVAIMTQGSIWVTAGAALTPASLVAWDPATGKWKPAGTGFIPFPLMRFDDSAAADGDLVRVSYKNRDAAAVAA